MILKLKDGEDSWVESPTHIWKLVDDHFLNVFKSRGPRDWGNLLEGINIGVTDEMNLTLMESVSLEEIKEAAIQMGGFKAPSPNGFQGIFYRSSWEIIVENVNNLVKSLMQDVVSSTEINNTHIVLIPKFSNPKLVSHFQPISLCNYSYKVLSKVLANRLKVILRQIQDNIRIAHKVFHFLKGRKSKNKFELGIKVDMQKAYDRVEWDFLEATMEKLGFCRQGLRHGDPLSSYMFLLIREVLSRLIQVVVENKSLDGVKLGVTGPVLSHIFFADDMLIFFRANVKNCRNLVNLLRLFCDALCQEVNLQKSSALFRANTPVRVYEELGSILGMPVVDNSDTYLGILALWGRSKKHGLAYVKRRILEKLQGWKNSTLSKAGKEVLIKAVVQAIPAYPMNIFKFSAMSRDWDIIFLLHFFSVADQEAIEGTPIGDISRRNRLIWAATKNGRYTVKSGYRSLQSRSLSMRDHHLPHVRSIPEELWNCIWKVDVPPKIRHFLWNSLHNILATKANLYKRRSTTSLTCPICLGDDETVEHLLILCLWINRLAINSWISWLHAIFNPTIGNPTELLWIQRIVAYTCWYIWKAMCAFVFNQVQINPINVVLAISNAVGSFLAVSNSSVVNRFKMLCSGFVGVVLCDVEAHFIVVARYHIRPPCAAAVETITLLHECELGAALGFSKVVLESDSSEAISCLLNSMENGSWEAFPNLGRVKLLGETFQNCRWSWVPRSANMAADALKSCDSAELCDVVSVDRLSSSLVFVLINDGIPCPH
ncbi:unnamed protein product [Malus baccata var. baccata]